MPTPARAPHLLATFTSLWRHRELVWQLSKRDVSGRYRGSVLGLFWSFLHPLVMLSIYSFVFGVVFQARWQAPVDDGLGFAMVLFSGLIVYSLFAECVNRAPGLILANQRYVKKIPFPLEILPWVNMASALFHAGLSLLVLLLVRELTPAGIPWTALALPLILLPLVLLTMALSWFLASCGVFLRDTAPTVGLVTTALLFASPVFYPASALPEAYRPVLWLNPLTPIIEAVRGALFWGRLPDWSSFALYLVASVVVAWLGLLWFDRTRPAFADVV
jgi:lipopolysaccharide transport system permease protein